MKADNNKLNLILAQQCKSLSDLRSKGLSPKTLTTIQRGGDVKPVTLGRLARALGIDPVDIIDERS